MAGLNGVKIGFIASGSTSAHCVALGVDGAAYAWGKNNLGQPYPDPEGAVAYLKGVGGASSARHHTAHTLQNHVWATARLGGNAKRGAEYEAKPLRVTRAADGGGLDAAAATHTHTPPHTHTHTTHTHTEDTTFFPLCPRERSDRRK